MKSAYVFKFFFAIGIGALLGERVAWDYARWHQLGREAFLTYQGAHFDRFMAHPSPPGLHIVVSILMAVGLLAIYEAAAFLGAKAVSLIAATIRSR